MRPILSTIVHGAATLVLSSCSEALPELPDFGEGVAGEITDRCVVHVTPTGNDSGDGHRWETSKGTVQSALLQAGDEGCDVWVAAGTYSPTTDGDRTASFEIPNGVSLYGGFTGDEVELQERVLDGHEVTVLSGDIGVPGDVSDNSFHVVRAGAGAVLDGVTVSGGTAGADFAHAERHGAGVHGTSDDLEIRNCTFRDNRAEFGRGGAVYSSGGYLTVLGSRFEENRADEGGALFSSGGYAHIEETVFQANGAGRAGGTGGALATRGDYLTISKSVFRDNWADGGAGAIDSTGKALTISDSELVGNEGIFRASALRATGDDLQVRSSAFIGNVGISSASAVSEGANARFIDSKFINNDSDTVSAISGSGLTIEGCLFEGNDYGVTIQGNDLWIERSVIANNNAYGDGVLVTGGSTGITNSVLADDRVPFGPTYRGVSLSLVHCTVIGHSSEEGLLSGAVELRGTVVWNRDSSVNPLLNVSRLEAEYSLSSYEELPGAGNLLPQPPGFVDIAARDLRLTADSPLRDRGNPEETGEVDIDGTPRGHLPDIGAYEFVEPPSGSGAG